MHRHFDVIVISLEDCCRKTEGFFRCSNLQFLAATWAAFARSAGVDSAFAIPTGTIVVILVLAVTAGVLASIRPARRAARLDVLDALATA